MNKKILFVVLFLILTLTAITTITTGTAAAQTGLQSGQTQEDLGVINQSAEIDRVQAEVGNLQIANIDFDQSNETADLKVRNVGTDPINLIVIDMNYRGDRRNSYTSTTVNQDESLVLKVSADTSIANQRLDVQTIEGTRVANAERYFRKFESGKQSSIIPENPSQQDVMGTGTGVLVGSMFILGVARVRKTRERVEDVFNLITGDKYEPRSASIYDDESSAESSKNDLSDVSNVFQLGDFVLTKVLNYKKQLALAFAFYILISSTGSLTIPTIWDTNALESHYRMLGMAFGLSAIVTYPYTSRIIKDIIEAPRELIVGFDLSNPTDSFSIHEIHPNLRKDIDADKDDMMTLREGGDTIRLVKNFDPESLEVETSWVGELSDYELWSFREAEEYREQNLKSKAKKGDVYEMNFDQMVQALETRIIEQLRIQKTEEGAMKPKAVQTTIQETVSEFTDDYDVPDTLEDTIDYDVVEGEGEGDSESEQQDEQQGE
jgi:hypothetical protein